MKNNGETAGKDEKAPEKKIEKPLSIVEQINDILQEMMRGTPLESKGVRLMEDPRKGVVVWVGLVPFAGVDAVTDPEIKEALRPVVAKVITLATALEEGAVDVNAIISDRAAVDACLRFADDHRVLVEPACGAALAAGYFRAPALIDRDPVVIIVCGGVGVTRELLQKWDEQV